MLYPIALTVMGVMIVAGLMVYVVPKVVNVFTASHAQLPSHDAGADQCQ